MKSLKKVLLTVLLLCALTVLVSISAWADGAYINVPAITGTDTVTAAVYPAEGKTIYSSNWYLGTDSTGKLTLTDNNNYGYSADAYITADVNETGTYSVYCDLTYEGDMTKETVTGTVSVTATEPPAEPSFSISPAISTVNEGESVNFSATTQNMDGYAITWFVSPTSASVTGSTVSFPTAGSYTVSAVASNGTKTVYPSNTCSVTVNAKTVYVTGITIDNPGTVFVGIPKTLTAQVSPGDATNKTLTWSSNHPEILAVNSTTGALDPKMVSSNPVVITATATDGSGVYKDIYLTVADTKISISSSNGTELGVGNTSVLTATDSDNSTTYWAWSFTDSDFANYVKLTQDGSNVAGIQVIKGGKAVTVQATNRNGKSATITINATAPSTGLSLSTYTLNLNVGGGDGYLQVYYNGSVIPGNYCTWKFDPSIISVNNGTVRALKSGASYVTATYNGMETPRCTVTVNGSSSFFTITAVSNNSTFDGVNPLYFVTSDWYNSSTVSAVSVVGANNVYSRNLVYGTDYLTESSPDGHLMVKLNPVTLHNLPQANYHNIAISNGAQIAYARFWRAGTSYNVYGVRTADDSNAALWGALCMISFVGAAVIITARRKDIFAK